MTKAPSCPASTRSHRWIFGQKHRAADFGRLGRLLADRAALRTLRLLFGFDPWHANSPDSSRPYRRQLAVIINGLNPKMVVEVGCGLGGILSRVRAHYRWGLDIDSAAIAAARFIHGRSARFLIGSFEQLPDGEIDVLLAVNWLHDFPPEQVERWIAPLLPRVGSIIVDSVVTGTPGYRYHHRFGFLDKMGEVAWFDAAGEPHRKFLLWKSRAE